MRSCGRLDGIKHKGINNSLKYINLDIYLKLDCLDNRKVTSSGSRYYVGISGKGLTNSLNLRTRMMSINKLKSRTDITDIVPQDFMKLLE